MPFVKISSRLQKEAYSGHCIGANRENTTSLRGHAARTTAHAPQVVSQFHAASVSLLAAPAGIDLFYGIQIHSDGRNCDRVQTI